MLDSVKFQSNLYLQCSLLIGLIHIIKLSQKMEYGEYKLL